MDTIWTWIIGYVCSSLFYAWILFWGGDRAVESWWGDWNAEQNRLYALLAWVGETIIFIPVLFYF